VVKVPVPSLAPDQRVFIGAEPDEVAVVGPGPLEELERAGDAGPDDQEGRTAGLRGGRQPGGAGIVGRVASGWETPWCDPFAGQSRSVVGPARRNGRIGLSRGSVHMVRVPADQGVHFGASLADRGRHGRNGRRLADQSSRLARVT
jgi:hypothetical protein